MKYSTKNNVAIVGAGPTSLFLLRHISLNSSEILRHFSEITIYEKSKNFGFGMPYNSQTTDVYNIANICCEEIPGLPQSLNEWILSQDSTFLKKWNIEKSKFSKHDLHSRLLLGTYFEEQFKLLINELKSNGFKIIEKVNSEIVDIIKLNSSNRFLIQTTAGNEESFSKIVIATGHQFTNEDSPECNYFASPWPIKKLIPKKNQYYNFPIGLLGASLSAFDVTSTLAHRHGTFEEIKGELHFKKNKNAENFKVVLHSSEGWLPHLQYEQLQPLREVYRHTTKDELLSLLSSDGFLSIQDFFDKIGRKVLIEALKKDKRTDLVTLLSDSKSSLDDLIEILSKEHKYVDSFVGMEQELKNASKNILQNKPTFWMETLDDLMYCLNFHSDILSAEDHIYLRSKVMPFLMNVIAALPLKSARILLALHKAKCVDLKAGKVEIENNNCGTTKIKVTTKDGQKFNEEYKMFINCAGQKTVEFNEYPFPSLVSNKIVSEAKAKFANFESSDKQKYSHWSDKISIKENKAHLNLGGIDIDYAFRVVKENGLVQENVHDLSCSHISGVRPYSYGLQASDANAAVLVESWLKLDLANENEKIDIEDITEIYDDII
jgi:uncharacterized NAD(P)/FAD-binding protein YdhS